MTKNKVKEEEIVVDEVEVDMRILGKIRDNLYAEFEKTKDINAKISIAAKIESVCSNRQNSEVLLLRLGGFFDEDEYCEGCPECDAGVLKKTKPKPESESN